MNLGLKDKVVVVTGGTAGIGEACALGFANEGAKVAVCSHTQKRIGEFQVRCKSANAKIFSAQVDVGSYQQLKNFADTVVKQFSRIDVWINNAGILSGTRLLDMTEDEWDNVVKVNLKSVFAGSQIAARIMQKTGGGVILNASSFASIVPSVGGCAYGATKAAIANMTKTMAAELAPFNIRVNAYIPGIIDTPMNKDWIARCHDQLVDAIAMHRVGKAEEVANALIFAASDAASYITGTTIQVSGGKLAVQNAQILWQK